MVTETTLKRLALGLGVVAFSGRANAWGPTGHETVGYVAMNFLAPKALSFVQNTLDAADSYSLGPAATWPDRVRKQPEYKYSAVFHFIDVDDDPLNGSCSIDVERDCAKHGCLLSAITNYTQRVTDENLPFSENQEALKFLDHLIGESGQPLHVEAYKFGGNLINATCGGQSMRLHAIWDDGLISTYLGATGIASSTAWAASLVQEILVGDFKDLAPGWLECSSTTARLPVSAPPPAPEHKLVQNNGQVTLQPPTPDQAAQPQGMLACPLVWARESNALDCSHVFKYAPDEDLCTGPYFQSTMPLIRLQIAKQGYRLAAWLNMLFDGATFLP